MLEIRHFPRFFHEMSVPEGNATCNAENKHGGLELTGLLKFRVVAEPRNSGISAKSREIDKNT